MRFISDDGTMVLEGDLVKVVKGELRMMVYRVQLDDGPESTLVIYPGIDTETFLRALEREV